MKKFKKILIANRSEIAIRVMRAANELELKTVAIYAEEDKLSLHRFKADEAYRVGAGKGPIEAYLDIPDIIRIAKKCGADAIHPGYGFLSERPDFADACVEAGITFIGPPASVMRSLGDKVSARNIAEAANVPVTPATSELPEDMDEIRKMAAAVGYPLMLKASWGGGGRGMRVIETAEQLEDQVRAGRSEALSAFGRGEVYLEKLIRKARHVEVQILGDSHGNVVHLFERDCSVQRRHQKIVERAPAPYLNDKTRKEVCDAALKLMRSVSYEAAGTVEFLMDSETDAFYFIEVNPRVQVEHTVTEEITGIDIVKAQIRIAQGGKIGVMSGPQMTGVPAQKDIQMRGCALQARVTTEDPEIGFVPDYGRITAYRGAMGFGIRLDGGTAYSGAVITRHYDSLLEKVTAWAPTEDEVIRRLDRALREFRIRGVATNITFLENLINHPTFKSAEYTTRFIDETPELFKFPKRRDRATKLLNYIADVTVNGHPQTKDRPRPVKFTAPPEFQLFEGTPPKGTKQRLDEDGPEAFAKWMVDQKQVLITDTTMRDAHQSLLATRIRSYDIVKAAPAYAHMFPQLLSLECWGGATFDVAMRFLQESPWKRLRGIREGAPNLLLQMLLRGSNGVGYTNYPDNVVQHFIHQAADQGVDLFRVFDSLNWVENMRVAMDAVRKENKLCEAAICYTGDILSPDRSTYDLDYYLKMGADLKAAGAHILAVKDMAGLLKPEAAKILIAGLKKETGLPVHFHTHDTSGIAAATVLAAVEAGVDAADLAMDSLSGLTSQPNLGSVASALQGSKRDPKISHDHIRTMSGYWAGVREQYAAFEANLRSGASEVYVHEMPGGQFTNLKEQARSLGLERRWDEIANTYADVNMMFGDIPKVTPSSKVVGDMALAMISAGLTRAQIEDPSHDVSFPDSVISFFKGELGQPPNGFPKALQGKVLKGEKPLTGRPGETFPPADLTAERAAIEKTVGAKIGEHEFASYLMYPKVFTAFAMARAKYGPVDILPTPIFFYGMEPGDDAMVDLEPGKTLNIRLSAIGDTDDTGEAKVFFELNGQPRAVRAPDRSATAAREKLPQADPANMAHVGAPMRGMIATVAVEAGQKVEDGDLLLTLEAMKMETSIHADKDGTIKKIYVKPGDNVDAKDMLVEFEG